MRKSRRLAVSPQQPLTKTSPVFRAAQLDKSKLIQLSEVIHNCHKYHFYHTSMVWNPVYTRHIPSQLRPVTSLPRICKPFLFARLGCTNGTLRQYWPADSNTSLLFFQTVLRDFIAFNGHLTPLAERSSPQWPAEVIKGFFSLNPSGVKDISFLI